MASFGEGATIMRQRFPRKWFENPVYLDFEGHPMPCPADYDRWLTVSYGNYMEFPPEEEQVARHDIVFMDLDRPYTEYRGIYYCTDRT